MWKRLDDSVYFPLLVGFLYACLAGALVYFLAGHDKVQLELVLVKWVPWNLRLNFLLMAAAAIWCRRDWVAALGDLFLRAPAGALPSPASAHSGFVPEAGGEPFSGQHSSLPALPAPGGEIPPAGKAETAGGKTLRPEPRLAGEERLPLPRAEDPHGAFPDSRPNRPPEGGRPGGNAAGRRRRGVPLGQEGFLFLLVLAFAVLVLAFVSQRTHRIYFDEDIYANVGQNMANSSQAGMCNYGTFEYGEYYPHWLTYNKEPSGWPFLISVVFQLCGTDEAYAFFLNNLLLLFGVWLAWCLARELGGGPVARLSAALAFALIPHNLIWFNTIAAEPAAAVFGALTALLAFVYLRTGAIRHLFALAVVAPFACYMRPESGLIAAWAAATILLFAPGTVARRSVWALGALALFLLLPHLVHLYAMSGNSWGAPGDKFSLAFFIHNLKTNGLYYLNNRNFPVLLTALALAGVFAARASRSDPVAGGGSCPGPIVEGGGPGAHRIAGRGGPGPDCAAGAGAALPQGEGPGQTGVPARDGAGATVLTPTGAIADPGASVPTGAGSPVDAGAQVSTDAGGAVPTGAGGALFCPAPGSLAVSRNGAVKSRVSLVLWFFLFWGIFLFFYAGSYQYGADVRFALVSFMPLAVLAGIGGEWLVCLASDLMPPLSDEGFPEAEGPAPAAAEGGGVPSPAPGTSTPSPPAPPCGDGGRRNPAGFGGRASRTASLFLLAALLYSALGFWPLVRAEGQEAWAARYDHLHAREFLQELPRRSIVLTHIPTMFLLWGQGAIQTYAGVNNPEIIDDLLRKYDGHVYFHFNYWCNLVTDDQHKLCIGIRERYRLEEIAAAREQSFHYGLYKLSKK